MSNYNKPKLTIEEQEDGKIRLTAENVYGQDHAIYLLSSSITNIIIENTKEESTDVVQELPTTDEDKE